jgi:hypothetical protein
VDSLHFSSSVGWWLHFFVLISRVCVVCIHVWYSRFFFELAPPFFLCFSSERVAITNEEEPACIAVLLESGAHQMRTAAEVAGDTIGGLRGFCKHPHNEANTWTQT